MKASNYLIHIGGRWFTSVTIAPEIDREFWLEDDLVRAIAATQGRSKLSSTVGQGVEGEQNGSVGGRMSEKQAGAVGGGMSGKQAGLVGERMSGKQTGAFGVGMNDKQIDAAASIQTAVGWRLAGQATARWLLWKKELPLGDAIRAQELWNQAEPVAQEDKALALLAACIEQARREVSGAAPVGRVRAGVQTGASLHACAERWERAAAGGGARSLGVGLERGRSCAEAEALAAAAQQAAGGLQGRALLRSEAHALFGGAAASGSGAMQLAALLGRLRLQGAVAATAGGGWLRRKRQCRCLRCGSGEVHMHRTPCASCGRICAYCSACLAMGRSRECELLLLGMPSPMSALRANDRAAPALACWKLSPAQAAATTEALRFLEATPASPSDARSFLLWAVTGAGKTEMIFPLVESIVSRGGKALIATPRRDVVLELEPRIRRAFPDAKVIALYGGSEQRWEEAEITLATTHQLMRFQQNFQLVIIDELDAFPYHGDPILHYAADKCRASGAARLLLSATPPAELQRLVKQGILPHARVPVRYHRHPLPVPKLLRTSAVKQMLESQRLPSTLLAALNHSLERGAQLFVFVQRISQVDRMAILLQQALTHSAIEGTSSEDGQRAEKVQKFRSGEIRVLVTTTILERGVTIPRSDVYILDADGRLFDEASLVQMAGRAGRSADDPNGLVYFCAKERTRSQVAAVRHIRTMNKIAASNGYLLET